MRTISVLTVVAGVSLGAWAGLDPEAFANPPAAARPWAYWLWQNGNVEAEDVTVDLEAIKRLGFGGVLMFDNRGYGYADWLPPVKLEVMTDSWFDRVAFAIRECARIGLEFSMNASCGGGSLSGFSGGTYYEVDITDAAAVSNHLDRYVGPIVRRVPDLVGKTFTHIYSVSWEGRVPDSVKPAERDAFILRNFYGVMRDWAHTHGFRMQSESGGPWHRTPNHFAESNQLAYLGVNDLPQGEFWPQARLLDWCAPMHLVKPVASAARLRGLTRVSVEAFTHMTHHWSLDPAALKADGDAAFVDGANHFVWHTFTCSPTRWGVPGCEYFAGTHINQNVTWHGEARAFVDYLARCQYLLQYGKPVADLAVNGGTKPYLDWGHHRLEGHDWDLLDAETFATLKRVGDRLVLPSGRSYPATLPPPDCESCGGFAHRRSAADDVDVYFITGPVSRSVTVRAPLAGRRAELWDPVTGKRAPADATRFRDGRTRIRLDLPKGGSTFVVLSPGTPVDVPSVKTEEIPVAGPWHVSFAYHKIGSTRCLPNPRTLTSLVEWTSSGDADLRHFAGRATYATAIDIFRPVADSTFSLALSALPSGLARVFVNGRDCGVAWCAPWTVDVTAAIRAGRNEIRIEYVNNWHNRLVGDAARPKAERVTATAIPLTDEARDEFGDRLPYSKAVSATDPLIPSGLTGPVKVIAITGKPNDKETDK